MENTQYDEDSITLLVLERGAEWPSWGTGIRMRALNSAVEVQTEDESIEQFQKRVEQRLARIAQCSQKLVAAGYACALDGHERTHCRRSLCTRILTVLSHNEGAELILAGGSWETTGEEGMQRSRLIELWGELSIQVPGRLMSVRFEDPPSESGVFRAAQDLRDLRLPAAERKIPEPRLADRRLQDARILDRANPIFPPDGAL